MSNIFFEFNKRMKLCLLAGLFIAACGAGPAGAGQVVVKESYKRVVRSGVVYYHVVAKVDGKPVHIHVADIDLKNGAHVQPVLAWDHMHRLETVSSMAKRNNSLISINGSYFNRTSSAPFPVGFIMIDGRVIYFSHTYRSAFGITRDGRPLFGYPRTKGSIYLTTTGEYFYLWGMNRNRKADEAIVFTPEYGASSGTGYAEREIVVKNGVVQAIGKKNMNIPGDGFVISLQGASMQYANMFKKGTPVKLYFVIESEWLNVYNALTGGPLLLKNGSVVLGSTQYEQFGRSMNQRNPVTAVGSTPQGHLLFVVADGRRKNYSVGLSYYELAEFMSSLGAVDAIAMDGGGSSTMVVEGKVVNRPSDGSQRGVSNSLAVFENR